MRIQVDAMIPSSRLVPTSLNKGRPVVVDEPSSEVSTSIKQLATKFIGQHDDGSVRAAAVSAPKKKRGLFSRT